VDQLGSLFGGFAQLLREADEAQGLLPPEYWKVAMVVAVVAPGPKPIGSTGGMLHTKETSPYYPAWESTAPGIFDEIKAGVVERDFDRVARAMEHSARLMHATMMTAQPPVLYWKGATVDLMHLVSAERQRGRPVAYTMDAGPNVKVLTTPEEIDRVVDLLKSHPEVQDVIVCRPGPGASPLSHEAPLRAAVRTDGADLPPLTQPLGTSE
jgi:diphosphomevalonate decarboxylase